MDSSAAFLALDFGTTTLAAALMDDKGRVLARAGVPNPQKILGSDVISRLEAAHGGRGKELQTLLSTGIKNLVSELVPVPEKIRAAAAAGNSALSALLLGLEVSSLLFPPHRLHFEGGVRVDPSELDLGIAAPFYLFPLAGGFVGGDLVAFLYGRQPETYPALYLDIGTNAEAALFTGDRWLVTSVAAGPAFEGGSITWGMAAETGAIEGATLKNDRIDLKTRGKSRPRGICGSGLAAIIAAALKGGLLDRTGTIREPGEVDTNLSRHVREDNGRRWLSVYRDADREITLTQQDIRNFQLAKGAIRAGVECLLAKTRLAEEDIRKVYLTGSFGLSIDSQTLKTVAMLPSKMVDKVDFIADGVLQGVRRFLFTPDGESELRKLAEVLIQVPLSGTPVFEKTFIKALDF